MDETLPLIVIIEDDAGLRRAIERLLRLSKSFDPKPFECADDADVRRHAMAAKCLILDIQLPRLSGPSFYLALAEPRPPVIFITAFDGPATQRELSAVGQYALIIKPFLGQDLLAALNTAMRQRP
ncbi:response regulator [Caballeronia sp. LZ033]|uniref:response regulator n=1 Tax=Caballeronia sp. LZ033 TaxID=3038566 RepID=UPI00285A0EE6|nr:response regulator [Caballeronia sp. LZ033]MDR5817974.1 response regulator [Caballeronia sp. LZ033]